MDEYVKEGVMNVAESSTMQQKYQKAAEILCPEEQQLLKNMSFCKYSGQTCE